MFTHTLWRMDDMGNWHVIKGCDKNHPCCSKYERVLPIGRKPQKQL